MDLYNEKINYLQGLFAENGRLDDDYLLERFEDTVRDLTIEDLYDQWLEIRGRFSRRTMRLLPVDMPNSMLEKILDYLAKNYARFEFRPKHTEVVAKNYLDDLISVDGFHRDGEDAETSVEELAEYMHINGIYSTTFDRAVEQAFDSGALVPTVNLQDIDMRDLEQFIVENEYRGI